MIGRRGERRCGLGPVGAVRALAAALVVAASSNGARAQERPNIVLVVADDLGLGDLEPYGQAMIATPHLAALATRGATFRRAYAAAPVCAPSRCAMLTGLHAGHCSVRRNRQPNVPLGLSDPTIADALASAGYDTAFVGKWGLGGESEVGTPFATWSAPEHVGFLHTTAFRDDEGAVSPFPLGVWRDGTFVVTPENAAGARGRWTEDLVLDEALAMLDSLSDGDAPFFLVVSSTLPHRELYAPHLGGYGSRPWPEIERTYAAMVSQLDADVGRLVARLEETGEADHTLVVVVSDNGPHDSDGHTTAFFDSTAGLRGQKRDLYEGGVRVPLLVAGPGISASEIESPVSLVDLLPTFAEVAHAAAPDGLDGTSLVPLLGGAAPEPRTFLLGAAESNGGVEPPTRYAFLEWPLVLVERADGGSELYDLSTDPTQSFDLAAGRPLDVERLRALRIAASTGSIVRADPVLSIVDGDLSAVPPRTSTVVLDLDLTGTPPFASHASGPALVGLGIDVTTGSTGVGLDRARSSHVVVASHPAVSMGEESFGVEARVSLTSLAVAPTREERRWLALVKPTGTPDGAIDWGVLVQAADAGLGSGAASPGALALVFGRGRLREDDVWVVRSTLVIEDHDEHRVAVRFDAELDRVTFELDGAHEEITLPEDLGHVRSDGPLVLGAHHAASGVFDEALGGTLSSFRLLRGATPAPPPDPPRTLTVEVGSLVLGGPSIERTYRVVSTATPPSRAMTLGIRDPLDDPRLTVSLDRELVLGSTDEGATLTITVAPSAEGPIDATFSLDGAALRLGHAAAGSPITIVVHGRVGRPADAPSPVSIGVIEVGVIVLVLTLAVLVARRRGR